MYEQVRYYLEEAMRHLESIEYSLANVRGSLQMARSSSPEYLDLPDVPDLLEINDARDTIQSWVSYLADVDSGEYEERYYSGEYEGGFYNERFGSLPIGEGEPDNTD